MTSKDDKKEESPMKHPFEWLFTICLMLLGCVIALSVAVSLLAQIWPWIVGIGLLIVSIVVALRVSSERRRRW